MQTILRASLQQRVLASTPSGLHQGATAASSATAVGRCFQQSLLEDLPLLHRAVSGFRYFRGCSLLHDSINVEVASMGESITGMQPFNLGQCIFWRCTKRLIQLFKCHANRWWVLHAEGSIAAILKQPGSGVEADEVLFQIETDKVTIDVRAPQSGTLEEILVWMPVRCASSPAVRVN